MFIIRDNFATNINLISILILTLLFKPFQHLSSRLIVILYHIHSFVSILNLWKSNQTQLEIMVFQDSPIWKGMAVMEYQTEQHKKEGFIYFISWFQKVSVYLGCADMTAGNTLVHAGRVRSIGFYIAADWEMEKAGGKWVSPSQVHSYWLSSTNQAPSATVCTVFRRLHKLWTRHSKCEPGREQSGFQPQ